MAPHAAAWDADKIFPVETLRGAAALGLAGIYTGDEHGGSGDERGGSGGVPEQAPGLEEQRAHELAQAAGLSAQPVAAADSTADGSSAAPLHADPKG
jgi:alkylation response protein AidB-like acyl-CoA dehydrogenase